MENKFYIDDFERYLKEKADDFKMYPSRRVWNSIYNDMHPGSRWPSISMCIVLIGTLFLVGFLNTNTTSNKSGSNSLAKQATPSSISAPYTSTLSGKNNIKNSKNILSVNETPAIFKTTIPDNTSKTFLNIETDPATKSILPLIAAANNNTNNTASNSSLFSNGEFNSSVVAVLPVNTEVINTNGRTISDDTKNLTAKNNSSTGDLNTTMVEKNNYYQNIADQSLPGLQLNIEQLNTMVAVNEHRVTAKNIQLSEADKFWIENYALYNRPAPKKWKGKLSWQTYFTPSVVYRSLQNSAADKALRLTGIQNISDINNSVTQTPSFGAELGTGLRYDLSKRIKIKGGIQLNFTRYNAHAFDNGHPIATSLTMLSDNGDAAYEVSRISPYNSTYGITPVKLHNQTYQVSIPLGADYKIAAVDNVEWYAGATIQPTFVLGSRSYLISTDRRNYVKESDMLNRFNLNAGFETFVSIKTSSGITWQIGPQFRRQIFSTNNKIYSIDEKLSNYGLKIGIIKKL
jgi:hypothetical protein